MAKRIMVVTLSFGSGHITAAQAVAAALSRESADCEIRVVDALEDCRTVFKVFYVWPYWAMIRFAPKVWKWFFGRRVSQRKAGTAPVWAWTWGCKQLFSEIKSFGPDLMVCCEVGACEIGVIARRKYWTTASILNVITDFEAEPIWVQPEISAYAVANESVGRQLSDWGAAADAIKVVGIPLNDRFGADLIDEQSEKALDLDERPVVLLMGGGMGPTSMDLVAKGLLDVGAVLQVVALPGKDERARRKLCELKSDGETRLKVLDWTDDIAALMRSADILVTKPGGVTLAEAVASNLPMVFFDAIPGPEEANAKQFVEAGAAIRSLSTAEAVGAVTDLLQDRAKLNEMAKNAARFARPDAAREIAKLALEIPNSDDPVMILAISNGSGHIRVANGIAAAIKKNEPDWPVMVIDIADHMSPIARFTHVTAYLWIVKYAPAIWGRIDRFQKGRDSTSPDWFYRRNCSALFDMARSVRPRAIVATEVGCCEIAALLKRDLELDVPLVAVNSDPDTDKAWVKPEVDLYCFATGTDIDELAGHGARRDRIVDWGPLLAAGFGDERDRRTDRQDVCEKLGLETSRPIVLIAGGGEGLGRIEEITSRLLHAEIEPQPQFVVLTGKNRRLAERCRRLGEQCSSNLRVPGWIDEREMPGLMRSADILVSKLGNMFNEAVASELPLIALEPPPGSERLQFELLAEWSVGRQVRTIDELVDTIVSLLKTPVEIEGMRKNARAYGKKDASDRLALWLSDNKRGQRAGSAKTGAFRSSSVVSGLIV